MDLSMKIVPCVNIITQVRDLNAYVFFRPLFSFSSLPRQHFSFDLLKMLLRIHQGSELVPEQA